MSHDASHDPAETEVREGRDTPRAAPSEVVVPPRPESIEPVPGAPPPQPGSAAHDSQKTVISQRPPASGPAFRRAANPFEMGATLAGERLGQFQLEEFIGGGGMGAVFRASDLMLGRTVAVKVVSRDETNEDTLRRFRNEAQSAARLDHPNIARVYYVGEDKGWNYIVFEYIEGINVRDLVDHSGPLSLDDAVRYTLQIAEALDHAAQRDVTHRDIKPSNILIMADGRAKLVDMGLARLQQVESSAEDLTASGVTLGTFDYISPEQARDPRNTDVRSDLYSLGCTLHFMLTGQPPFPEGTVLQKLLSHSSDEPPDVRQFRPDLPDDIARVVKTLLAKLPEQRYQSPRELMAELLRLADVLNLAAVTATSTFRLTPPARRVGGWARHVPWMVPAAILAVILAVQAWLDHAGNHVTPPLPRLVQRAEAPAKLTPAGDETDTESPKSQPLEGTPAPPLRRPDDAPNGATSEGEARGDAPDVPPPAPAVAEPDVSAPAEPSPTSSPQVEPLREPPIVPADTSQPAGPPGQLPAGVLPPFTDAETVKRNGTVAADWPARTAPDAAMGSRVVDPHILVVSDEDMRLDRSMLCVRSLPEALERAAELRGVDEIQLRFNGLRMVPPLVLQLEQFGPQPLTIRAADGFSPILAFDANGNQDSSREPAAMIRLRQGRIKWRDTHFYVQFPTQTDDPSPRSLFQLEAVVSIEFSRCSFTIRNVGTDGLPAMRNVSCLHVLPPVESSQELLDTEPLREPPAIRLADCVARGQTTLVRSEQAAPFRLTWDHGLFISSEQLIELCGAPVEPPWASGRVALGLERLLVLADRGICLAQADRSDPHQLALTVRLQACLIAARLTRPPTPLYLFRGTHPLASDGSLLVISGSNNFYKNTRVLLRVESLANRSVVEEYTFDDLKEMAGQTWYTERNPLPATVFSWLPPPHSADRQRLDDFVAPGSDGWLMGDLDITPSELPRFPDYSSLLPRADLRLPQATGGVRGS